MLIISAKGLILGAAAIMYVQHLEIKWYRQENQELREQLEALREAK